MRFHVAIVLSAFLTGPVLAEKPSIDDLLADLGRDTPGLTFGVVRDGELVYSTSAGMAGLTHSRPFRVETVSNLGSTTKQFTAFAVALLAERGELSLDDPVSKYFPDLPDFEHSVTLRHLLSHTSGYREMLNTLALAGVRLEKGDYIGHDAALDVVRHQPALQNRPGESWNYNNTGYVMLARVVEQVSDKSFGDFLDAEVFTPLGMENTELRSETGQIIAGRAAGYNPTETGFREVRDLSGADGAGGLYSTLSDMARWMDHLGEFSIGGQAVREMMTTPYVLNDGESTEYGMGLFIDEIEGQPRWHHGGADMGHRSVFVYYPELDSGYMMLSNHMGLAGALPRRMAALFFDFLAEAEPGDASDASSDGDSFDPGSLTDEQLERLTGRYELEKMPGFILSVFVEDGQLNVQGTNQPAIAVQATSPITFTAESVGARFEFHVADDGTVPALTLHQGQSLKAQRLPDEDTEAPILTDYVGRYYSPELETVYTLSVEDGALVLDHRRLRQLPLAPVQDDTFTGAFPVVNVRFERGEDGAVTALYAGNGRTTDIKFARWAE
ncbi:MAG: serine hydrolase [Wenzhouxiangellaceae bacterium]|nr:serine hydrolase [Wenzhouxiangellaceae bacterium]MBS3747794.1 serine hydrolase [Wenzhouxiangellaceae bacterium]MBS3824273.1 serine hydrolase [Wenzhouxiangellaceae bacterium]